MEPSRYFYPHNQYSFIIQRFTEIPSSFEILVQPQDTLQFRLPGAAFCFWALLPTHTGCSAPVLHSAASCSPGSKGGHFRQKTGMDGKGGRSHRKRSYSMRPKNTRILVLKVFSKWQWWMKAFNTIQNNGVVCHSYYLGLTARCRLCTRSNRNFLLRTVKTPEDRCSLHRTQQQNPWWYSPAATSLEWFVFQGTMQGMAGSDCGRTTASGSFHFKKTRLSGLVLAFSPSPELEESGSLEF